MGRPLFRIQREIGVDLCFFDEKVVMLVLRNLLLNGIQVKIRGWQK
jgi:hypothetical protein